MTLVAGLAVAVAVFNVVSGRLLARLPKVDGAYWRWQAMGFFLRLIVIFGTAWLVWNLHRRDYEVAVFIVVAVIMQLVGQVYLHLQKHD